MIYFYSSQYKRITLEELVKELTGFMSEAPNEHYNIVIGTDSEPRINFDDFVSAVIIHRVGKGGRYFWRRVSLKKSHAIRDRIYQEVLLSLKIAQLVVERMRDAKEFDFSFEIHVDVGSNGLTRNIVQEVVGLVRGSGFEVKTKPSAFGASNVADRHL